VRWTQRGTRARRPRRRTVAGPADHQEKGQRPVRKLLQVINVGDLQARAPQPRAELASSSSSHSRIHAGHPITVQGPPSASETLSGITNTRPRSGGRVPNAISSISRIGLRYRPDRETSDALLAPLAMARPSRDQIHSSARTERVRAPQPLPQFRTRPGSAPIARVARIARNPSQQQEIGTRRNTPSTSAGRMSGHHRKETLSSKAVARTPTHPAQIGQGRC